MRRRSSIWSSAFIYLVKRVRERVRESDNDREATTERDMQHEQPRKNEGEKERERENDREATRQRDMQDELTKEE